MNWSLEDHIVSGTQCDVESLRAFLETLLEQMGCITLELFVYYGETFFDSLNIVVSVAPQVPERSGKRKSEAEPGEVWWNINDYFPDITRAGKTRLTPRLLAIGATSAVRNDDALIASALRRLGAMVSCTGPVLYHTQRLRLMEVYRFAKNDRFDPTVLQVDDAHDWRNETIRRIARELLLEVARTTRAVFSGIVFPSGKGAFDSFSFFPEPEANVMPSSLTEAWPTTALAKAVKQQRSEIENYVGPTPPTPVAGTRRHARMLATVATPLRHNLIGYGKQARPIIFIHRYTEEPQDYYGFDELLLLQEVAAWIVTRYLVCLYNASFYQTRKSIELLDASFVREVTYRITACEAPSATPSNSRIPYDFTVAETFCGELLGKIRVLCEAVSATVRLVDVTGRWLVRFCAVPPTSEALNAEIDVANESSVNAWVARTGQVCFLDLMKLQNETTRSEELKPYPGLKGHLSIEERESQSEICFPIFAHRRLVGTINIESRSHRALDIHHGFLSAQAAIVGLALEEAQAQQEFILDSTAFTRRLQYHEMLKVVDRISDAVNSGLQPSETSELAGILRGMLETNYPEPSSAPQTVLAVIEAVIAEKHYNDIVGVRKPVERSKSSQHFILLPAIAAALRIALREILYNASRRALLVTRDKWPGRPHAVWCACGVRVLGGKSYAQIAITSALDEPLPPEVAYHLYRSPIGKADRLHIGALAAALLLRNIGGDLYLRHHTSERITSVLEVPHE